MAEVQSQAYQIEKLKSELHGHRKARFGSKSESLDQLVLDLAEDAEIEVAAEAQKSEPTEADSKPPKRQHSRKPLPDHLERQDEVLSPGEECTDCGGSLRQIGEDITEELEYLPGRFVVRRIIRPRMACTCCEAFAQAALPSRPIERGRPGPGLLAHVLVGKYCDHLPLDRQSKIFARENVHLPRSTLTDWVGRSTALLEPLAYHIGKLVRAGPALFADDTPVKLQSKLKPKKTQTARLWSYVRDERPWCGDAPACAWYQFSTDRKGEHPVNHLSGYTGTAHADGFAGFNGLFGDDKAAEMACMVHVRRKFVDEFERTGADIAKHTITQIAELYVVEKEAKGKTPEERVTLRQEKAKPIFDKLEAWLQAQLPKLSGKTKLAGAIRYALGRMPKARAYLSDGRLELDNNICERSIRPILTAMTALSCVDGVCFARKKCVDRAAGQYSPVSGL
uniref:IS66 family transposase n=1 Tax=Ruegeria jejuensis TaxID=3233338 RepID=UPI00355ACECF